MVGATFLDACSPYCTDNPGKGYLAKSKGGVCRVMHEGDLDAFVREKVY